MNDDATTAAVPLRDAIAELKRELAMRGNVYPKLVAARRMTQGDAEIQTERLRGAIAYLRRLERAESPQGVLL